MGVDVFFVISGFLITGLLLRQADTCLPMRAYAAFLSKRAGRLVPGLVLAVAVVSAWSVAIDRTSTGCTWLALTHTMNIPGLGGDTCAGPWHVTWSLAAEEQFYLVWPLCLYWLVKHRPPRAAARLVGAAWLLSAVTLLFASYLRWIPAEQLNYAPWGRSLGVLAGCALALHLYDTAPAARRPAWTRVGWLALIAIAIIAGVGATRWAGGQARLAPFTTGATTLLLASLLRAQASSLASCLRHRLLVAAGQRSYSLYLQHMVPFAMARAAWPQDQWIAVLVGLAGAAVMAELSYRVVEQPLRRACSARVDRWLVRQASSQRSGLSGQYAGLPSPPVVVSNGVVAGRAAPASSTRMSLRDNPRGIR